MATTLPRQLALAEKHFRNGNHGVAEPLLREALARAPANAKANELLAYIAGNRGDMDESFALLKTATAAPEASGEAFYYLGKHFLERALFEDAAAACQQALRRNGNFFEGLHDLGVALSGCGKAEAAVRAYDQAIALQPGLAQPWFNKGVALDALRRFDEALQCYDKALALDPAFSPAWRNRGATLNDLGRYDEALASHERDIAANPRAAQAWSNHGVTLAALKRYPAALASQDKALALDPQFAEAWVRGAGVLVELKYPERALAYYAKALALNAQLPYVQGNALFARMLTCHWSAGDDGDATPDIETAFAALHAGIERGQRVATPFEMLAIPATPDLQRQCAEIYTRDRNPAGVAVVRTAGRARGNRIKVGYFSPDFRTHPLSFLTAGLYECHDRERFETHAFSFCVAGDDPLHARVRSAFEYFHDVQDLSDQHVAALAQRLRLDIAVDLAGHTEGARTGIFARRAAPIQVNYLGFPGTMGAPFIDYLIADRTVVPETATRGYSEKLVWLPHCFQVNDARRSIANAPTRAVCGLPDDAFVFCCFNGAHKINAALFTVWMKLLAAAPRSVLWLAGGNEVRMRNLRAAAAKRGVPPERLVFAGALPYAQHLARYALADLALDTLPFNGHTTTSDALWGGAPVLTCLGDTFAGRVAASLLQTLGLEELVTRDFDAYQALALTLARDPGALAALRHKLAANRATSPLFDTALSTRHIEVAYTEMQRRFDAGLAPVHLDVAAV